MTTLQIRPHLVIHHVQLLLALIRGNQGTKIAADQEHPSPTMPLPRTVRACPKRSAKVKRRTEMPLFSDNNRLRVAQRAQQHRTVYQMPPLSTHLPKGRLSTLFRPLLLW